MKISFDLDDTLIPAQTGNFLIEDRTMLQDIFGIEPLRKGTSNLFKDLRKAGHQVGIYTTSYRSPMRIRTQFWSYSIGLDYIINENQNRRQLSKIEVSSSKYPPAFDIDLHVDDSLGVEMEGTRHGFEVLVIGYESDWDEQIRKVLGI